MKLANGTLAFTFDDAALFMSLCIMIGGGGSRLLLAPTAPMDGNSPMGISLPNPKFSLLHLPMLTCPEPVPLRPPLGAPETAENPSRKELAETRSCDKIVGR
jgi:hypothetical protein